MTMHHQVVSWMQFFTPLPRGSVSRQQTKISNIRCHHRSPPSVNAFAARLSFSSMERQPASLSSGRMPRGMFSQSMEPQRRNRRKIITPEEQRIRCQLIEFGRYAAERRVRRGLGKPETFNFLGFTHICGRSRSGVFQLKRQTRRDRMRARLRALEEELQRRMHEPIPRQGKWLRQVVRGYFAYHAVPTNGKLMSTFRHYVMDLWRRALQRRSQRDRSTWARIAQLAAEFLPPVPILHPWPSERFAVKYPRRESGA